MDQEKLRSFSDIADRMRNLSDEMFRDNPQRSHHYVMPHKYHLVEAANAIDELIAEIERQSRPKLLPS
jgi:hypothetical protein